MVIVPEAVVIKEAKHSWTPVTAKARRTAFAKVSAR